MRHLSAFVSVGILGLLFSAGCGSTFLCEEMVCECTEAGLRAAIELGGGPFTFDCDESAPPTIMIQEEIVIDNDVILDGTQPPERDCEQQMSSDVVSASASHPVLKQTSDCHRQLTVDGDEALRVFSVSEDVVAELRSFTVVNSRVAAVVVRRGLLALTACTVSENAGSAVQCFEPGTVSLTDSTVSSNGGGIYNSGSMLLKNSTMATRSTGINRGTLTIANSTISRKGTVSDVALVNVGGSLAFVSTTLHHIGIWNADLEKEVGTVTLKNTLVVGGCDGEIHSDGYNIESSGDTCMLVEEKGDQLAIAESKLGLGELCDNGGPTQTHLLSEDSPAIDSVPVSECVGLDQEQLLTDQRGSARPQGTKCDIGAFEYDPP